MLLGNFRFSAIIIFFFPTLLHAQPGKVIYWKTELENGWNYHLSFLSYAPDITGDQYLLCNRQYRFAGTEGALQSDPELIRLNHEGSRAKQIGPIKAPDLELKDPSVVSMFINKDTVIVVSRDRRKFDSDGCRFVQCSMFDKRTGAKLGGYYMRHAGALQQGTQMVNGEIFVVSRDSHEQVYYVDRLSSNLSIRETFKIKTAADEQFLYYDVITEELLCRQGNLLYFHNKAGYTHETLTLPNVPAGTTVDEAKVAVNDKYYWINYGYKEGRGSTYQLTMISRCQRQIVC